MAVGFALLFQAGNDFLQPVGRETEDFFALAVAALEGDGDGEADKVNIADVGV